MTRSADGSRIARLRSGIASHRDALLLGFAAALLAATFLRPGWPMPLGRIEFVAVFDITQSMNVADQQEAGRPASRLVHAKAAMERALRKLPCGSKAGLAVFTEYRSFLLLAPIEVCEHRRELLAELAQIDGRMAWAGNSEVAKGINSAMQMVHLLPTQPALVFLTDGHEAPPVNPRYRPSFALARGDVRGLLLGVGGDAALPIPKLAPSGEQLGEWRANEVLQVDPRSLGRGGSVSGEQMVEPEDLTVKPLPGASPGREHLSALREAYLELIGSETGLAYRRLGDDRQLLQALADRSLLQTVPSRLDLRPFLAGAALLALLAPGLGAWRSRRRRGSVLGGERARAGAQPLATAAVAAGVAPRSSREMRPQR